MEVTRAGKASCMDHSALCRQILDASLGVRRGQRVWVNGWDHTADLVYAMAEASRERGCKVVTTIQDENSWLRSVKTGPKKPLTGLSPEQRDLLEGTDYYVFTLGPRTPVKWADVPQERRRLATIWWLEDNGFVREWKSIAKRNEVKMVGIEATLATAKRAETLGLDLRTWKRVMYEGCLADPEEAGRRARKLSKLLRGDSEVRITSSTGTDLRFKLDNRPIEYSDGTVSRRQAREGTVVFLPAGAIGVTVDERSAEGTIAYDNPLPFPGGVAKRFWVRLEGGRIIGRGAASNSDQFWRYLVGSRGGNLDRLGYFGIGLNQRLRFGYTQDDKVLGSIELNFGENRSRGGKNRGERNWWGAVHRPSIVIGEDTVMLNGGLLT